MACQLCDICHIRPTTIRATVMRNGRRKELHLCDVDYRKLARQQGRSSPLESLFGQHGGIFGDFFDDDFFGGRRTSEPGERPVPIRTTRSGSSNIADRLSSHAEEILQTAARHASEMDRGGVDTEHLLLALLDSEVVRTVLKQFKMPLDDLRNQIMSEAPRGGAREGAGLELETELARALLEGRAQEGDRLRARWDAEAHEVVLEPLAQVGAAARPAAGTAAE